jgi:hypothetical protein
MLMSLEWILRLLMHLAFLQEVLGRIDMISAKRVMISVLRKTFDKIYTVVLVRVSVRIEYLNFPAKQKMVNFLFRGAFFPLTPI